MEEAEHYYFQVMHALHEHVRRMAAVKIPQKRFKVEIRNIFVFSLDVSEMDTEALPFEDQIIDGVDYERFLNCLTPTDAKMLAMRLEGYS